MNQTPMTEFLPVENTTAMPIYVGATMIPAGETRHFPAHQVPEHLRPAPAEPVVEEQSGGNPADAITELAGKTIAEILPLLGAMTVEELHRLQEIETAKGGDARKGVLTPVAEELLKRAAG